MLTIPRRRYRAPAAWVLALVLGAPALVQAQQTGLFPLAPIRRERVPCPEEDPVYGLYRQQYFGYFPTCWHRFPPGWGCPSAEAPNAAQSFRELPLVPPSPIESGEGEPGALENEPMPGETAPAPKPSELPPLPPSRRSPFDLDTAPESAPPSGAAPRDTAPAPGRAAPRGTPPAGRSQPSPSTPGAGGPRAESTDRPAPPPVASRPEARDAPPAAGRPEARETPPRRGPGPAVAQPAGAVALGDRAAGPVPGPDTRPGPPDVLGAPDDAGRECAERGRERREGARATGASAPAPGPDRQPVQRAQAPVSRRGVDPLPVTDEARVV